MKKYVAYYRVSTKKQGDSGLGLEAQKKAVTTFCKDGELIAEFMDLPLNFVKVLPVEAGGAFGGKSHQVISPICALLSKKTGRPVKIVMTREEDFKTNRPAPASMITVKMGVTKDGYLTAVSATMIYDFGALLGMTGFPEVTFLRLYSHAQTTPSLNNRLSSILSLYLYLHYLFVLDYRQKPMS